MMNPSEKAGAKDSPIVEHLTVPAVQNGNNTLMNNAAITLKCPSCGGVFLTLQQSGSNLETCPHCAVAAPRVNYQPVQGNPQGGQRTVLPAKRPMSAVPPETAPAQQPAFAAYSAPQNQVPNPFNQPPIHPPQPASPAGFGWPPATEPNGNATGNNTPPAPAPAGNNMPSFPPHMQGTPVQPPHFPPPVTSLFPPGQTTPVSTGNSPIQSSGTEVPNPFAGAVPIANAGSQTPPSDPGLNWLAATRAAGSGSSSDQVSKNSPFHPSPTPGANPLPFQTSGIVSPAEGTSVNPFSSIPAPTSSASLPPTAAASFSVAENKPLFSPSSVLFPPAPAKPKDELPSLFKTVDSPAEAPSKQVDLPANSGTGSLKSLFPTSEAVPSAPLPATTPFGGGNHPFSAGKPPEVTGEIQSPSIPAAPPGFDAQTAGTTGTQAQPPQTGGFASFTPAAVPPTTQTAPTSSPTESSQGSFPSPFFRQTDAATPPTPVPLPTKSSSGLPVWNNIPGPATNSGGQATLPGAAPQNGSAPAAGQSTPAWPGLGMNHPSLNGMPANSAAFGAGNAAGPKSRVFDAKRTTATMGGPQKSKSGGGSAFLRKTFFLLVLSALGGAALWFFRDQPKSIEVPAVTISPTSAAPKPTEPAKAPEPEPKSEVLKPDVVKHNAPDKTAPPSKPDTASTPPSSSLPPPPVPPAPAPEPETEPASAPPPANEAPPLKEEMRKAVPADAPTPPSTQTDSSKPALSNAEQVLEVRRLLNALFNPTATTPERMKWIIDPEKYYDAVEDYFKPDTSFDEKSIQSTSHTVTTLPEKETVYLFRTKTSTAPEGVLIRMQSRFGQPPALDWLLFSQSHSHVFDDFSSPTSMQEPSEPKWFQLLCKRSHEFDLPAGTREEYMTIEGQSSLQPSGSRRIYVHLDSTAGRYLDKQMEWDKIYLTEVLVGKMNIGGEPRLVVLDCKLSK